MALKYSLKLGRLSICWRFYESQRFPLIIKEIGSDDFAGRFQSGRLSDIQDCPVRQLRVLK